MKCSSQDPGVLVSESGHWWDTNPVPAVLCLGLIRSAASPGIWHLGFGSPALPLPLPFPVPSVNIMTLRRGAALFFNSGLQTEIPPVLRRARSICFGQNFDKNFPICSKTFWTAQWLIFVYLLYVIPSPLFLFQFIFTCGVLRFLYWDHPVLACT